MDTMDVESQAKYALMSHVRTRNRGGHGRSGKYPLDFDRDALLGCIEIEGGVADRSREVNAVR